MDNFLYKYKVHLKSISILINYTQTWQVEIRLVTPSYILKVTASSIKACSTSVRSMTPSLSTPSLSFTTLIAGGKSGSLCQKLKAMGQLKDILKVHIITLYSQKITSTSSSFILAICFCSLPRFLKNLRGWMDIFEYLYLQNVNTYLQIWRWSRSLGSGNSIPHDTHVSCGQSYACKETKYLSVGL